VVYLREMRCFWVGCLLAGAVAACGDDSAGHEVVRISNPNPSAKELSNNSSQIDGEAFGKGTQPLLRKVIRIDRLDHDDRLSFGPAYALGDPTLASFFLLASQVTNTSNSTFCFVKLMGFRSMDAAGTTLMAPMYEPYLDGSVMDLGGALWTDTCLRSQETGWLLDIELVMDATARLYDALDGIEFTVALTEASTAVLPTARVVPTGYHVTTDRALVVDFLNEGPGSAQVGQTDSQRYVALDDVGDPVFWSFLSKAVNPQGTLKPGTMGTAEDDPFFYGTAHRIRGILGYHSPDFGVALLERSVGDGTFVQAEARARYMSSQLEQFRQFWRMRGAGR